MAQPTATSGQVREEQQVRGAGRMLFAAFMLLIVGTINIIYGIGALDSANIYVNDTRFVLDNLNTLGWVLIIWGVVQLTAGFSLMAGNAYGRVMGVIAGSLGDLPVVVARRLRPMRVDRLWNHRLRRRREGGPWR